MVMGGGLLLVLLCVVFLVISLARGKEETAALERRGPSAEDVKHWEQYLSRLEEDPHTHDPGQEWGPEVIAHIRKAHDPVGRPAGVYQGIDRRTHRIEMVLSGYPTKDLVTLHADIHAGAAAPPVVPWPWTLE